MDDVAARYSLQQGVARNVEADGAEGCAWYLGLTTATCSSRHLLEAKRGYEFV